MKKKWAYILILLIGLTAGSGCEKGERYNDYAPVLEPIVSEYYNGLGITDDVRSNALAEYRTMFDTEQWAGVKVRIPEYFSDLYYVTGLTQNDGGHEINQIVLSEKYNADEYGSGVILRIHLFPHSYYEANEWLQETPFPSVILGSDVQYVYMLQLTSDVQYNHQDELATALYFAAYEINNKFISDFVKINEITSNGDYIIDETLYSNPTLALESVGADYNDIIIVIRISENADLDIIYNEKENNLQLIELLRVDDKIRIVKSSGKLGAKTWEEDINHKAEFFFTCESAFFELGLVVSQNPADHLGPGESYALQNGYYLGYTQYKIAP